MDRIGEIMESSASVEEHVKNKEINQFFVDQPSLRSIVVIKNDKPIAHIPKTHFYQKIGTLYGYNLYMGRANSLLAKLNPLVVDFLESITHVSKLAMNRSAENLYDDIIVTKDEKYVGVVSVKSLLLKMAASQVKMASLMNPLSILPGNHLIEERLNEALSYPMYSILYFDLDRFKLFNDIYGFKRGDKVLLYLTQILKECILNDSDHFLGHIGGDDFVAILPHYQVEPICNEIILRFDKEIGNFYDKHHLTTPMLVKNRDGEQTFFSPMTLSIAITTNEFYTFDSEAEVSREIARVKAECKTYDRSCYIISSIPQQTYSIKKHEPLRKKLMF